jgi:hypothetical protein
VSYPLISSGYRGCGNASETTERVAATTSFDVSYFTEKPFKQDLFCAERPIQAAVWQDLQVINSAFAPPQNLSANKRLKRPLFPPLKRNARS